jgi:hypothetical protein
MILGAVIHLATRYLKLNFNSQPSWWEVFDASIDDINSICDTIMELYARPKPSLSLPLISSEIEEYLKNNKA